MINFWLLCIILLIIASFFLIVPTIKYLRGTKYEDNDVELSEEQRRIANVRIFKERMAELEAEQSSGNLSADSVQQIREELEASLLNDVKQEETHKPAVLHLGRSYYLAFMLVSLLFVSIFSLWFYGQNGAKDKVDLYLAQNFSAQELDQAKEMAMQGDMDALLNQLHAKLKQSPDNIEGWQLLARSAMTSQRFSLAIEAYEQILRIYDKHEENPAPIYGLLAQAKYYQSEGSLNVEIQGLLDKALSLDPEELNSLGLKAIDAFSNDRLQEAKTLWERILSLYPEHPARPSIEAGIQRANLSLGLALTNGINQLPGSEVASAEAKIEVNVSISPDIRASLSDEDTVFVLARNVNPEPGKPNVPLAVSRHQVRELPITITLDDSKAMSPMAKLSSAEYVTVIARVSKSGNPMPQPGDFEAVSADLKPLDQGAIELIIQTKLN